MVIQEQDFRLTPVNEHSAIFDLELLYTIRPKGKEARQEYKNVAYGISLESAISKIAQFRVTSKHEEEAVNLLTYFTEFTKELKEIRQLCGI